MRNDEIQTNRWDCDEIHEMKFDEIQILLYLICQKRKRKPLEKKHISAAEMLKEII